MTFPVLMVVLMALAAAGFLGLGFRGLFARAPLVFPSRRVVLLILPCFLPGLLFPFFIPLDPHRHPGAPAPWLVLLPAAITLAVLLLVWKVVRGYTVLGAEDRALAPALRQAVAGLGLAYEESLGSLHLTAENADLTLHVQPGTGSAQIRLQPEDPPLLDRIAAALAAELARSHGRRQPLAFVVFAAVGALLLGVAAMLFRLP